MKHTPMAGPGQKALIHLATCDVQGVREVRGSLDASGLSFGIAVGRFHMELTRALSKSVVETLIARGAAAPDITVVWVPGAFEVPSALEALAAHGSYQALIGLGAVVAGETSHADNIVSTVARALRTLARESTLPVLDGIVEAPTYPIAEARCLPGPSARGPYLAEAAVEIAQVMRELQQEAS